MRSTGSGTKTSQRSAVAPLEASGGGVVVLGPVLMALKRLCLNLFAVEEVVRSIWEIL